MTKPIPVKPYPLWWTHDSLQSAIDGANSHPLQQQAKTDTERLAGSSLVDARWSDSDFVLRFSNGVSLHVFVQATDLMWRTETNAEHLTSTSRSIDKTIGDAPVVLRWPGDIGDQAMDCSSMIEQRIGAGFYRLFVNELGLLVYLHSHPILFFSAIRRTDTDQCILHLYEED